MYDVQIQELEPMSLAVLRHTGSPRRIGETLDRLCVWAAGANLLGPESRSVAVYLDDPDTVPEGRLRVDVGIVLPPGTDPGPEVRAVTIPGGRHAVIVHQGPYAELADVHRWLSETWLPGSGEIPAARPRFEQYLNDPAALPPTEWRTAICLPLADRT